VRESRTLWGKKRSELRARQGLGIHQGIGAICKELTHGLRNEVIGGSGRAQNCAFLRRSIWQWSHCRRLSWTGVCDAPAVTTVSSMSRRSRLALPSHRISRPSILKREPAGPSLTVRSFRFLQQGRVHASSSPPTQQLPSRRRSAPRVARWSMSCSTQRCPSARSLLPMWSISRLPSGSLRVRAL